MILGPVFRSELIRTARRRVDYGLRVVYGFMLLAVVGLGYGAAFPWGQQTATIGTVSQFARDTFSTFAFVQVASVLVLVPAFFGGTIVDEKQRKTLHYLMASDLSSGEIVLDKTLGRLPRVAVYSAIGLPVVALLGLFGGVEPLLVLVAYAGTLSAMTFAIALSVFVSTLARRVRTAVLVAYVATAAWIIGPVLIHGVGLELYPNSYATWQRWVSWLWPISPFYAFIEWMIRTAGAGVVLGMGDLLIQMVALQLGGATILLTASALLLRPVFRRQEESRPRRAWFGSHGPKLRKRWGIVPPCGDDPVAWRERYFARTDAFTRLAVLPTTVVLTTILILISGLDETMLRMWNRGTGWNSEAIVDQVRLVTIWYAAIWLLAVAGASASCVAIEREADTWITLTSTPLTGRQILWGKALGAIWAQRGFVVFLLLAWGIGLLSGALHPLGVLAASFVLALETWLVAAIGIHASTRSASTSKALGRTLVIVFALAGYPVFILLMFSGERVGDDPTTYTGLMARLVQGPLVSWSFPDRVWSGYQSSPRRGVLWLADGPMAPKYLCATILLVTYGTIAAWLTARTFGRFDAWLDRPRAEGQSWGGKTSGSI